ncbi:MAG: hypothetical protein FD156_734 [Nitrospirae bacterium]|nr:MAG: hypothetical protein FD156_734 [Nitrospirota bacterium]
MGHTIVVDENIYNALISSVGKEHMEERMEELLLASIEGMLEDYTKKILKFEEKYGMAFSEFESLWDSDALEDKHSHEIESDYIDWEMMEIEKKELLTILANLKRKRD